MTLIVIFVRFFFICIWGFASEQGILGWGLHRLSARGRRRDLGFHLEPDVVTEHGEVPWQTDSEFIDASRAEHAMVGDYELLVFDLSGRSNRRRRRWLGIIRTAPPPGANRPRRRADI